MLRPRKKNKLNPPRPLHIDGTALVITFKGEKARCAQLVPMLLRHGLQDVQCIDPSFEPGSASNYARADELGLTLPRETGLDFHMHKPIEDVYRELDFKWPRHNSPIRMTASKVRSISQYFVDITDGGVGAAVSHAIALEKARLNELPTLIVESDAHLKDNFTEKLNSVMSNLKDTEWDILLLAFKELAPVRPQAKKTYPQVEGACVAGFCWNTTAYVVTPKGARKILQSMQKSPFIGIFDDIIPTMQWGSPIKIMNDAFGPNQDREALITYRTVNTLVVEDAIHGRTSSTNLIK